MLIRKWLFLASRCSRRPSTQFATHLSHRNTHQRRCSYTVYAWDALKHCTRAANMLSGLPYLGCAVDSGTVPTIALMQQISLQAILTSRAQRFQFHQIRGTCAANSPPRPTYFECDEDPGTASTIAPVQQIQCQAGSRSSK